MKRAKHLPIATAILMLSEAAMGQITYPVVETNQRLFYNNSIAINEPNKGDAFYGQDAQYTGNVASYTDNGDGTITDNVTGLIWQKEYKVMSYDDAMRAAEDLQLGGYSDWRLPTIKEAYSLIMFSGVDASSRDMTSVPEGAIPFIDINYFNFDYGSNGSRSIDTQMLSSTIYIGSSDRQKFIFGVNMADGRIKSYPMNTRSGGKEYTVRFVRGSKEYGVNKFVDNGDRTISDVATGLMWQKDDSGKGLDWESALEYAQKMNAKNYLGYNDWRVPNVKELQSIVDYSRSPETTSSAAIDPMFGVSSIKNEAGERDFPFYWSSTTHCASGIRNSIGSAAAYVSFGRGLGNMQQMQMGQQGGQRMGQQSDRYQSSGERQRPQNAQGSQWSQQNREGAAQQNRTSESSTDNWINIHGAGCQRSDPKSGDISDYTGGRGPQGDAIRIKNYVRLVRDI